MAITICGKVFKGQDSSCEVQQKGHAQEIVIMNYSDLLTTPTVDKECTADASTYNVNFALKEGATGVSFVGPVGGNMMKGTFDKTRADNGLVEYTHIVHILMAGITQEQKCILDALDKGRAFAAMKIRNFKSDGAFEEAIEIFGIGQGMVTPDYSYDLTEGGGLVDIMLNSQEGALENNLPYIYKSDTPGNEVLDFEALFANPGGS